jgi:hypothetical protein
MLYHVVELHVHVVAIELSQATRRVRWKTLDSLPVNHSNRAGGRRELYCISILKYLCYIRTYLTLVFEGWIYEFINTVFSCWVETLSP